MFMSLEFGWLNQLSISSILGVLIAQVRFYLILSMPHLDKKLKALMKQKRQIVRLNPLF